MSIFRHGVVIALCLLPTLVFAQSADQEVVSVVDSPDPVAPGATLSYTVTVRNNGPNAATNGGLNINLPLAVTHTTDSFPTGWSCFWSGSNGTCSTPSFAAGVTEVITINATVGAHLANFPDQSITASFFPSGTTPDPNNANNTKNASTLVDAPQIDLQVTASDSPDPVFPDGNVTYTVNVSNAGPNAASTVNFNSVPSSALRFVSSNQPAGWSCTFPSAGAVNATFTCSRPTYAAGAADVFTIVYSANDEQFGVNDTTFGTNFSINGTGNEQNNGNNTAGVTTTYTTPDADVTIAVTDSPDPVGQNSNITYTVTVINNGPDTAPNATMSVYNSSGLAFVSLNTPAGWTCTPPAVGAFLQFSCSNPSYAVGAPSVFTVVANTDPTYFGQVDGTINTAFSTGSSISDPVNGNNSETESTAYVTPDADLTVAATDSPDPVAPDGDITYTVTVGNTGPDSASATLTIPMNGTLKFTSVTAPAGFVCTGVPPVGGWASFSCNNPSFANGSSAVFTVVLNADSDSISNTDQILNQVFSVTGNVADPDSTDNMVQVSTTYDVSNANAGVTATDAPDPVAAGGNLTYTGAVTNAGPDSATSVSLQIPLAGSLLFQSITGPAGFTCGTPAIGANGMITCTIASLANGANLPFTLVVQVNPTLNNGPDGVIQQGFLIGSSTNDPVTPNNTLQVDTQYTTPDAEISTTNSGAPNPVTSGSTATFTQTLTNNGPQSAVNATLTQSVPAGTTFQSITAPAGWNCTTPPVGGTGTISCSMTTLLSGVTADFTVVVNVTATSGSIASQVTGDSDTYDPNPSNNTSGAGTTAIGTTSADLAITKSTAATTAPAGSTFSYTIVLTNNGPDAAANPQFTDVLPASLLFRSITEPAGFDCITPAVGANGTITCAAPALANGASTTFTLVVQVAAGASGAIVNNVTTGSGTSDPNSGNSGGSAPGVVAGPAAADVSLTKSTTATSLVTGSNVTYTIAVANAGPSPATNVIVTDVLPAGLQFVSATPTQGTCGNVSNTVTCNLGTIGDDAGATITLIAQVTATSGTIANTATVSSTEGGGDSATTPAIPVSAPQSEAAPIPTMSEWALLAFALMLAGVAARRTM